MKYVLFAAMLVTLPPAQAGDIDMDVDCAAHADVSTCQEDNPTDTAVPRAVIELKAKDPETDCSAYPYVGICDVSAEG